MAVLETKDSQEEDRTRDDVQSGDGAMKSARLQALDGLLQCRTVTERDGLGRPSSSGGLMMSCGGF